LVKKNKVNIYRSVNIICHINGMKKKYKIISIGAEKGLKKFNTFHDKNTH
jgi:hypothetical protein